MSISTLHKLDKLVLPSTVEFYSLSNVSWDAGITSLIERPAGHAHPMFVCSLEQKPALQFTTMQLDVLIGVAGVGGASVGSTTTYFKKAAVTGNDARASTTHRRVVITSSCLYWTNIRLPHNGQAEAQCTMMAAYDGSNAPFAYTGSVALSGNLGAATHFGAGPVSINNTTLAGVQEITIESGIRLIQAGSSSELYDTFVGIEVTEPKVTIRTFENLNWATIGLGGTALDGTNGLVFYARKFAAGGSRVADGTAEHVKFVALNGRAIPMNSQGQRSSPISDTITFELISASDSVVPLVGTVSSAIT